MASTLLRSLTLVPLALLTAPLKFSTPSMDGGTTWVVTIGDAASPTS